MVVFWRTWYLLVISLQAVPGDVGGGSFQDVWLTTIQEKPIDCPPGSISLMSALSWHPCSASALSWHLFSVSSLSWYRFSMLARSYLFSVTAFLRQLCLVSLHLLASSHSLSLSRSLLNVSFFDILRFVLHMFATRKCFFPKLPNWYPSVTICAGRWGQCARLLPPGALCSQLWMRWMLRWDLGWTKFEWMD